MKVLARVLFVAVVVSALVVATRPWLDRAWFVCILATEHPPAALPGPVAARPAPRVVDSWGNPRPGGRRHQGIDIFASKDSPVLSTTRGLVIRIGTSRLGGQTVWILGPGLERHYYAHLNRYGAFREGDRVEAGDIIGYTGNTGNARAGASALRDLLARRRAEPISSSGGGKNGSARRCIALVGTLGL